MCQKSKWKKRMVVVVSQFKEWKEKPSGRPLWWQSEIEKSNPGFLEKMALLLRPSIRREKYKLKSEW